MQPCQTGHKPLERSSRSCLSHHPGEVWSTDSLPSGSLGQSPGGPVLKFFVVAVTAYGMSTLEGPLMSVKSVNAFTHFTDWTVAHAHIGALGWNGFMTFGMMYWLIPRLFNTQLFSRHLANIHFWLGTWASYFMQSRFTGALWFKHLCGKSLPFRIP